VAELADHLVRFQAQAMHPRGIGIRDAQIPINQDHFVCETVKNLPKMISHPLPFFQEPAPIVPGKRNTEAETQGNWQVM
jgi:hypothetical protein